MIGKGAVRSASLIPHFKYKRDCSFLISFIHVPEKSAKPLKLLLKDGGEKGRGTHV